jgi:hypothetical protein
MAKAKTVKVEIVRGSHAVKVDGKYKVFRAEDGEITISQDEYDAHPGKFRSAADSKAGAAAKQKAADADKRIKELEAENEGLKKENESLKADLDAATGGGQ